MSNRVTASMTFAALGVVTVFAVVLVRLGGMAPEVAQVTILAAIAAALSGALFGNTFGRNHPMLAALIGALAMLLSQLPFSAMLVFVNMGNASGGVMEILEAISIIVVFGWVIAWPFQAGFGAIAGLLAHRLTRPQDEE